jgi:hypothetical protein
LYIWCVTHHVILLHKLFQWICSRTSSLFPWLWLWDILKGCLCFSQNDKCWKCCQNTDYPNGVDLLLFQRLGSAKHSDFSFSNNTIKYPKNSDSVSLDAIQTLSKSFIRLLLYFWLKHFL